MSVHDLTLMHYPRSRPFVFDPDHDYGDRRERGDKPTGFWVSVKGETDWREWCLDNDFSSDSLNFPHEVKLKESARILHIDSEDALRRLDDDLPIHPDMARYDGSYISRVWVDWHDVIAEYDGIIIAPYIWECRMDIDWYYGWDCASGVIWNIDVIESVEPVSVNLQEVSA